RHATLPAPRESGVLFLGLEGLAAGSDRGTPRCATARAAEHIRIQLASTKPQGSLVSNPVERQEARSPVAKQAHRNSVRYVTLA
ncbi:hypothetical protein, partial [Cognatilysobacter segetis]|uniref:hypothetical protein n=1 Tax=Cognatilysobacter segetis TaxID=2492394 RepID=UPI001EE3EE4D